VVGSYRPGKGQALAETCFSVGKPIEQERRIGEHTIPLKVYKMLDALELSGTRHKAAPIHAALTDL
jgi:hypothetical protein